MRVRALVNCNTGKVVGLMVRTTNAYQTLGRGSLVFYNMGRTYWLTEVRFAHINMESQLAVQPKPEPSLARNMANTTIEIAMNSSSPEKRWAGGPQRYRPFRFVILRRPLAAGAISDLLSKTHSPCIDPLAAPRLPDLGEQSWKSPCMAC